MLPKGIALLLTGPDPMETTQGLSESLETVLGLLVVVLGPSMSPLCPQNPIVEEATERATLGQGVLATTLWGCSLFRLGAGLSGLSFVGEPGSPEYRQAHSGLTLLVAGLRSEKAVLWGWGGASL